MSSGASEADRDAVFASLSGPALVAYLRSTCKRGDYDAAARVLDVRDGRLARAEAQLAEAKAALTDAKATLAEVQPGFAEASAQLDALRKDYRALRAEHRRLIRAIRLGHPSRGAIVGPSPSPAPGADGRAEGAGKETAEVVDLRGGGGGKDWEDGEFRPDVDGVPCQAKESAPVGGEERRSMVSRKRKPPLYVPSSSSSKFDEEDRIPLSQLVKKLRGAKPVPNGKPKKGHGDAQAKNSVGPLGDHPPEKPPVISVGPKGSAAGQRAGASRQLKAATFLQRKRKISQPEEDGGLSRAMPSPPLTDSAVGNKPRKNSSMADGAEDGGPSRAMPTPLPMGSVVGNKPQKNSSIVDCAEEGPSRVMPTPPPTDSAVGNKAMKNASMIDYAGEEGPSKVMPTRQPIDSTVGNKPMKNSSKADGAQASASIGDKQGLAAGPQGYRPFQVRTPSHMHTARRIVESIRRGAEMPKNHTGSGPHASAIREQGGTNGILPVASTLPSADDCAEGGPSSG